MICRLCLNSVDDSDTIRIFEDVGLSLNVANVLAKYFWFEPKSDDPISTVICSACWNQVNDFHQFYGAVERAHRLLTERFSLKSGQDQGKAEREEDLELQGEAEEGQDEDQEVELPGSDCDNASFTNEQFLSDVIAQQEEQSVSKPLEGEFLKESSAPEAGLKDLPIPTPTPVPTIPTEERRETRSTTKSKSHLATEPTLPAPPSPSPPQEKPKLAVTKSRGKRTSCKAEAAPQKTKRYADYKQCMLEIDAKISAHMRLTCDICHEGQETFLLLCKHMLQEHRRKGYAICCNKKFYKRSFLTDHIDRHADPEKFKCTQCDKRFADKQCLRNHELLKHHPEEEKTFMCEQCPKRYTKQYLLDQHRVIHKERNVVCDLCERRFPNQSLLCTHVKMAHGNYGTMCDICAQVIRGRAAFQRHQLEHAGVTEPKVQCDICGSWHKNKHSLKKHVRRHNGTAATCDLCGKISPNRSAMLSHQRYVHLTDRKHECSVCRKAFKKAITLKEHMTMHTGEVLYKCPHCPKTFNSNANLHTHRKKCHPKEFEEARQARTEKRKAVDEEAPGVLTIATGEDGDETHRILLANSDEDLKAETIEFTLCLSPDATD
ncbi:transcription factor grauzone [Drosophila takahashii]|uniref:transcription factor grauzone n=1 Tax=Drosophila takahashii TaxID=29030 RepID=UPI001CF9222E|nr:transcription factor grauzone [Drosophila takahashii]